MRLEAAIPADVLAAIRAPFLAAGAEPVDIPVLQPLGLLLEMSGEAMRPRLFVVQAEGGEELALRPDFTIGVAQAHVRSGQRTGRYLYEGKIFRAAGDADRAEEFRQIGMEAYETGPIARADAEIVALAWEASIAGGRGDLVIEMGDLELFSAFLASLALDEALTWRLKRAFSWPHLLEQELDIGRDRPAADGQLAALLSTLTEAQAAVAVEELWALAGVEPVGGRPASEIAHRLVERTQARSGPRLSPGQVRTIRDFLAIEAGPEAALDQAYQLAGDKSQFTAVREAWSERLARLRDAGIPQDRLHLATGFSRDFRYYDGLLFEVRSEALGPQRPVAAGGRYDSLLQSLSGDRKIRAVGCMVRPGRARAGAAVE